MGKGFLDSLTHHVAQDQSIPEYTQEGRPKLFPGALIRENWPACDCWTSENAYARLQEVIPSETVVEVMENAPSKDTILFKGSGSSLQTTQMTFKDFMESSDAGLYLAQSPIVVFRESTATPGILYGMAEDVRIPSMLPPGCDMVSVNAWCSGKGRVLSSLHYDCHDNLLCVVAGQKIVRLAAFDAVPKSCLFDEHPYEWGYGNHTDAYTLFPEHTSAALSIEGHHVDTHHLHAGDVLYIPRGYWHQVLSGNDTVVKTIAINFWWDTALETNPCFSGLLQENARIAAHAWAYLMERAARSQEDIIRMFCVSQKKEHQMCLDMIQRSKDTDVEALVLANVTREHLLACEKPSSNLESMIAYAFSRGFQVFYAYLMHISLHAHLTRWMWHHATPTTVEYLTSGLSHLAGDTDTSELYQAMYTHIDAIEEFQKTLEARKMQFKSACSPELTPFKNILTKKNLNSTICPLPTHETPSEC